MHPDSEDYKADIKVTVEEHHEVEMKSGWSGKWPNWDTVHIPLRKKKLRNKRAPDGEDFYDIPISLCNFIDLGKDGE